jgi:hypothetical protein
MSIDMLKVEMTRITRQFKYYKPLNNLSQYISESDAWLVKYWVNSEVSQLDIGMI